MLQENSNGESSFEIVNKSNIDKDTSGKTSLTRSLQKSSTYSLSESHVPNLSTFSKQPASTMNSPAGNLLSNVQPPSSLPDFTLWSSPSSNLEPKLPVPVNSAPILSQPSTITQGNVEVPSEVQVPQNYQSVVTTEPLMIGNQFPTTVFR